MLIAGALLGMGRGLAYLVDEGIGMRSSLLDRAVIATVLIAAALAFGGYLRASMVNKIGEMVLQTWKLPLAMRLPYQQVGLKMLVPVTCYLGSPLIQVLSKR